MFFNPGHGLSNRELGAIGERLVAFALQQRGCQILDRNVRTRFGEIDVIAKRGSDVLFIEVKTRRTGRFGFPEESITWRKREHLYRASTVLAERYAKNCNYAILIVAVEIDVVHKVAKLRRIELDE